MPNALKVMNISNSKIIGYGTQIIKMKRTMESIGIDNDPQTRDKNDRKQFDIKRSQDALFSLFILTRCPAYGRDPARGGDFLKRLDEGRIHRTS